MNKLNEIANIILALVRQYWKYKFRDIGMYFATTLMTLGTTVALSGGAWKIAIALKYLDIPVDITFGPDDTSGIGFLFIIIGIVIGVLRLRDLGKKTTGIFIAHRGMEGMDTHTAIQALPKSLLMGKLEIIDLHEGHQIYKGNIVDPERAINVVNNLDQQIKTRLNGRDISEVKIAYAGLAPIPLLATAGYKVTSRQECLILDYSRGSGWHGLDNLDDLEIIDVKNPSETIVDEVAIVLPLSVDISEAQLPGELVGKTYTFLMENGVRPDSLNSTEKQKRIATQFYTLCANLKAKHPRLKRIHVFLAAQASFAFRIGSMVTSSVMPPIIIYQYDSEHNKYSWGVELKSGHQPCLADEAEI